MTASGGTGRSRYIDALRVVAILRVYLLHTLWWSWLPSVFPAMWVMFTLAGYLTAASLERRRPAHTIGSRIRRLLPHYGRSTRHGFPASPWTTDS